MNGSPGDFSPAFGRVSPEGFGQPLCLMSPIGRKASVEGGISPSDLAHSPLPPTSRSSLKSDCFLGSYRRLRKNLSLASLQLRKLSFRLRRFAVLARRRGERPLSRGKFPPHTLHIRRCPPHRAHPSRVTVSSAPTAVFARTTRSPRYSLASSASAYGGSQFLLDDAITFLFVRVRDPIF